MRKINTYRFAWDEDGVTPLISTMLLIILIVTIIGAVTLWSIPEIHRIEWDTQYRTMLGNMKALDAAVEDVVLEGIPGSTRSVRLTVPGGTMGMRSHAERWFLTYSLVPDGDIDNVTDIWFTGIEDELDNMLSPANITVNTNPAKDVDLVIYRYIGFSPIEIDGSRSERILGISSGSHFSTSYPLLVRIDEVSGNYTTYTYLTMVEFRVFENATGDLIGQAFLFDINTLTGKAYSEFGTALISFGNAGIVTKFPSTPAVQNPPILNFNPSSSSLILHMVQLEHSGIVSGKGNFVIRVSLTEFPIYIYNTSLTNFRLRVIGDFSAAWHSYLSRDFYIWMQDHAFEPVTSYRGFIPADEIVPDLNGVQLMTHRTLSLKLVHSTVSIVISEV